MRRIPAVWSRARVTRPAEIMKCPFKNGSRSIQETSYREVAYLKLEIGGWVGGMHWQRNLYRLFHNGAPGMAPKPTNQPIAVKLFGTEIDIDKGT